MQDEPANLDRTVVDAFYTKFFAENPYWSTPFPNLDEARRWAKIGEYLSIVAIPHASKEDRRLRILDIGCGRGWLTRLASVYGDCEGVEPVANSIKLARRFFPDLTFYVGTAGDLRRSANFEPYDVIVTSEVIEHVVDKEKFVAELRECLVPHGHVILTTPRGDQFKKWLRLGAEVQPVDDWITEKNLRRLFERHGFVALAHDRVYLDLAEMSLLHLFCTSRKFARALGAVGLTWVLKGLQYSTGLFQVWHFRLEE